jgi:hypothetical protein
MGDANWRTELQSPKIGYFEVRTGEEQSFNGPALKMREKASDILVDAMML